MSDITVTPQFVARLHAMRDFECIDFPVEGKDYVIIPRKTL